MISDGFLLDTGPRNSDPRGKLSQITDAALRAGVVIYTIDARGLFSGQLDATNNVPFDKQNRLESASLREGHLRMHSMRWREIPAVALYATRIISTDGLIRFSTRPRSITCSRGDPTRKKVRPPTLSASRFGSLIILNTQSVCPAVFSNRTEVQLRPGLLKRKLRHKHIAICSKP